MMKSNTLFILLLIVLVGACQSDQIVGPSDLLYQHWHLDRAKNIGDTAWVSYDTDGYYDTEYQPDGTLIHRKDGVIKPTSCCEAGRYERSGVLIQYSDFLACPTVFCAPSKSSTITILRDNLLELNDGQKIAQYNSVK